MVCVYVYVCVCVCACVCMHNVCFVYVYDEHIYNLIDKTIKTSTIPILRNTENVYCA